MVESIGRRKRVEIDDFFRGLPSLPWTENRSTTEMLIAFATNGVPRYPEASTNLIIDWDRKSTGVAEERERLGHLRGDVTDLREDF